MRLRQAGRAISPTSDCEIMIEYFQREDKKKEHTSSCSLVVVVVVVVIGRYITNHRLE